MKTDKNIFITSSSLIKPKKTNNNINIISNYKKNQKKEKEIINENFLNYLIDEQPNYANFDNVIDFYEEKLRKNKSKYNENLKIIEKKKEELKNLQLTTNNNILNNVTLTNKNINIYYLKIFEKIKNEIIIKEHELEIVKKLYNDLYKQNYKLNSKLETENKLSKISNEQHEKYVNIKDVSLSKLIKQEEMLKTLNFYFNECRESNEELISQKMEIIKKLNYEIHMLKSDEEKFNKNIEIIKDKANKITDMIKEKQKLYLIIYNDYKFIKKIFYENKKYMNLIYSLIGVTDVDDILQIFKKLRQKYNELSLTFNYKSKEIISLNEEITNLNKKYNKILNDINNKKIMQNKNNKRLAYIDNFEKLKSLIDSIKNTLVEKYDNFKDKLEIFNKCISLILRIIDNIINSTKNSMYKDIFIQYKEANKKRNIILQKYQDYYKNNFSQNKKNNLEKEFINKEFLKFIIYILNEFNYRINSITSNIYNIIYKKEINKSNEISPENNISNNSINEDININILPFNTKKFKTIFINELQIKKEQLEEQKRFYEENAKTNIKNYKDKTDKNDPYYLPFIDRDMGMRNRSMDYIPTKDFLYNYYLHYKKTILDKKNNDIKNNSTFYKNSLHNQNTSSNFYNNSTKFNDSDSNKINLNKFNFVIHYTNDFISDKKEIEAKKNEKYQKIIKKSKKIKENLEKEELLKYLKKLKKNKKNSFHYHSQDDVSIDTDEKNENEIREELKSQFIHQELMELKKPKKYLLKYENEEIGKIFERYDEIRMLELNFLKNKKNYIVDSSFFNEYYFKLKNQFKENNIKANIRKKFLKHKKNLFYKTMIQPSDIYKFKTKKENDNENNNKQKDYNNEKNIFYNTARSYNKKV